MAEALDVGGAEAVRELMEEIISARCEQHLRLLSCCPPRCWCCWDLGLVPNVSVTATI